MNHSSVNDLVRDRIRRLRTSRGIGVTELAAKAGIPVSSYASLERGAYRLTLEGESYRAPREASDAAQSPVVRSARTKKYDDHTTW